MNENNREMMNGAQEKWEAYIVNTGENIEEWDAGVIGEWAWAEIVAWADNAGEYFENIHDLMKWAMNTEHEDITDDMIKWAYEHAKEYGLPADWSIY